MTDPSAPSATDSALTDAAAGDVVGTNRAPHDARSLRDAAAGPLALRLPARWLEEHAVLPLTIDGGVALVAADGAIAPLVEDALQRALGAPIRHVAVHATDIRAALIGAPRGHRTAGNADDPLRGETPESLDDLRAQASREPVVQVVNAMLAEAVRAGASDIHVETVANGLRVRLRIDGVLHDAQTLGRGFQAAVVSRIKVLAALDIAERRLPQDGRARIRVGDREIDVRVSVLPALHGESLVLRLLDGGGDLRDGRTHTLSELSLAPAIHERFLHMLARSSGLVLVTGPTGSGKTTTLYAALGERSTPGVKVLTVEDPVEYRLDGVVQLPVNVKAGFSFPNALRAILRHDPDVILVGEMRDVETADIAVQAALTGHLVLSTLHTTDATGALARLTEMGVPPYLLAATLHGVLAQRLVRTNCERCSAFRAITSEERALLGSASQHVSQVREGPGCEQCAGTGFRGRAAIAELLVLDEALRAQCVAGASLAVMRASVRAHGTPSLRDDGWRLVVAGRTTISEVVRVVSEDETE